MSLAVLPGRLGIAILSPRLDRRGNSVRGVRACAAVARDFDVHLLDGGRPAVPPIRCSYTLADVSSRRVRLSDEREALDRRGSECRVIEVQGELELSAYERVAAAVLGHAAPGRIVLLDLTRVTRAEDGLESLLFDLVDELEALDAQLAVVPGAAEPLLARVSRRLEGSDLLVAGELDAALERCEEALLEADGRRAGPVTVSIARHPIVTRVPRELRAPLLDVLERRALPAGETLCRSGDPADELFLLTAGRLTVVRPDGTRAATLSAGTVVGELGAVTGSRRSADVLAATAVECHALRWSALRRLGEEHPAVHAAVLTVLLEETASIVRRLERELASVGPYERVHGP